MSVSAEKIREWKRLYGSIYQINLESNDYIYRKLNIKECEIVQNYYKEQKTKQGEEFVLKAALLFPDYGNLPKNLPAGDIHSVLNFILDITSVFNEGLFSEMLTRSQDAAEELMDNDYFRWKTIIMQTFSGYTFQDLDQLEPFEFFKLVAICERINKENYIHPVEDQEETSNTQTRSSFISTKELESIAADDSADRLRKEYYKQ